MNKLKSLLSKVSTINQKNAEILDATEGRFNIFQIIGVNHYENTHSLIIAELLNSKGAHSLKSKLFECLLETISNNVDFNSFNTKNYRVTTEYSTNEGRIDILLEDDNNQAIIIENKLYAEDQPEQLIRYNRYAEKKYKNGYRILYLTLSGDEASKQSAGDVLYYKISYKDDIINWLEKCVANLSRFPIIRGTIIQYINHLKQLTHIDMNTINKEEITKVLANIENLRAAKIICQNYTATFDHIIKEQFNPQMEKFAKEKGLVYEYEQSDEAYVSFKITSYKWKDDYWIAFTYEGSHFYFGVCNNFMKSKMSDGNRKKIHQAIDNIGGIIYKESDWWPISINCNNLTLDSWENDIINSDRFFKDCMGKIEMLLNALKNI